MSTGTLTERDFSFPAIITHVERENAPAARFSLLERMIVERGDASDWNLLHDLHYKAENLPIGPRFWKLTLDGETIGVLVTANPKGLLKERHLAFPNIKPGSDNKHINTQRYVWINQNIRVISRFVVDTMYRGIGAGYRTMNLVSRMEGNTFMEIQSSMSKFNIFGQKAGFRFVRPMNSNKFDQGLKFFRSHFEASPQDYEAIISELEAHDPASREKLLQACKDFYYRHSALEKTGGNRDRGQGRVDDMDARKVIKSLQQVILASPMYGVWKNPEPKKIFPDRLPLEAFDWQGPRDPFNWEAWNAWRTAKTFAEEASFQRCAC
jgi:ABC-type ATPase with predicted acetyltransferase domain